MTKIIDCFTIDNRTVLILKAIDINELTDKIVIDNIEYDVEPVYDIAPCAISIAGEHDFYEKDAEFVKEREENDR